MQFPYLIAILATLGLAQAQLPNLPSCSLNCFLSALQNDGCSSVTNFTCHCANPSLVGAITPCVQSACDLSDQSSVSNAVTSVCSSASVPISIPPVTGAGTTTTGSAATATSSGSAAAGSGSTTPSRTSGSVTASSSGTGGAGGGGGASSTSGGTSGGTSGAPASTSTGTGTTSTGTTGTTTGTTTGAPQATGAAGSVSVSFVGTGLFALGVAALFAL
ncbi:GPI-anchored CFEM domain protein [Talaromyces pinophilus]|nr:GPI-anchored CFEM domain protein [Talaromyces pinophilus]